MTTIYAKITAENELMMQKLDTLVETLVSNGDTFPDVNWLTASYNNRESLIFAIANDHPVLNEFSSLGQYLFLVKLYVKLGYDINIV